MRFLFVVPPLTGHVNPAAAVAEALADGGHEVAWAGPESFLRPVLGPDATIHPTGMRMYRPVRGADATRAFLDGYVAPLARFTLAAVEKAVLAFAPDVVVVDQHGVAGAVIAHKHGLPWASLLPTAMGLAQQRPPEVDEWVRGPLAKIWAEAGLPPAGEDEMRSMLFSPYQQIAFTTKAMTGEVALPDHAVMVGPALPRHRRGEPAFPLDTLDPARKHVLVTVGTLDNESVAQFYRCAVSALTPLAGVQGIVLARPELLPDPPNHITVLARTDVLALMPHLDAVVCHAGTGTVREALAHGVPLVLAPMTLDHPRVADQVTNAGAGIRVSFEEPDPAALRAAVVSILDDPAYRAAALIVADSFAAAGGAAAAAAALVSLSGR